jgi:prevent-host-death family protein
VRDAVPASPETESHHLWPRVPGLRHLQYSDWSYTLVNMKEIGASDFKARCLALIDEVGETGSPIIISKRGRQVAQLVPYISVDEAIPQETLRGTATFTGDVEAPVTTPEEWDAVVPERP